MNEYSTIVVIDDDSAMRKGLSMSLGERNYSVASFESAEAFLSSTALDRPGCLLLDLRMPGMNGLELQDELVRRGIATPIIFISGHSDIPMTARAMRHGAIDFLEKPYEIDTLLRRIDEALAEDAKIRAKEAERIALGERLERLSKREREVMSLIVAGAANMTNKTVAEKLGISHRTVDSYRARVMEKMQATSLPALVTMAKICGIYVDDEP